MSNQVRRIPNSQLRNERFSRNWSQQELASHIGTTTINVSRWERGITTPNPYFRQQLCHLFGKGVEELGLLQGEGNGLDEQIPVQKLQDVAHASDISSPIWNIPYRRNPFFTGREQFLLHLHTTLHAAGNSPLSRVQAISGMGGIGKTQTAIEYAYRFRNEYEAILWIRADTQALLVEDFAALARLLYPGKNEEQEQQKMIDAVMHWLGTHSNWLLILNNAEDIATICSYIPPDIQGHILLTTRTQATGMWSQRVHLEGMQLNEGIMFLLRRAKLVEQSISINDVSEKLLASATNIVEMMDGLPLALDQVGAYIEETGCSLADYLVDYQQCHTALLAYRGEHIVNHTQSISTTLSLSFEKIEQLNPPSAELLQFCSFLHPDAIPEEIFTRGATELGPVLQSIEADPVKLNVTSAILRNYSLLQRNPDTRTFTIHRLVQTLLKDRMSEERQRLWAERVVRAINRVFPDGDVIATWSLCQRCLPQVQLCIALATQWNVALLEAGSLLNKAGKYMYEHGRYTQAETFYQHALRFWQQELGPEHPDIASIISMQGGLLYRQGKIEEAKTYFERALEMKKKVLEPDHVDIAASLSDLGVYYHSCMKPNFDRAKELYEQALKIRETVLGPEHFDVSESLNNLAFLYRSLGEYTQAEVLCQRVLSMRERTLGLEHPTVAQSLNSLALFYEAQGKHLRAEPLIQRALAIYEQIFGSEHPDVASCLNHLARNYTIQGKYQQAEPLFQRALQIREELLGVEHISTAQTLGELGKLYLHQGQYTQAESLLLHALNRFERLSATESFFIEVQNNLGQLFYMQSDYVQAEPYFQRAVKIQENTFGPEHPRTAQSLHHLAKLYAAQKKYAQAKTIFQRALRIRQEKLGETHPDSVETLESYTSLLSTMEQEGVSIH